MSHHRQWPFFAAVIVALVALMFLIAPRVTHAGSVRFAYSGSAQCPAPPANAKFMTFTPAQVAYYGLPPKPASALAQVAWLNDVTFMRHRLCAEHAAPAAFIHPNTTYQEQRDGMQLTSSALEIIHGEMEPNCASGTLTNSADVVHQIELWDESGHDIMAGVEIGTGPNGESDRTFFQNYPADSGEVIGTVTYECGHDVLALDIDDLSGSITETITNKTVFAYQTHTGSNAIVLASGNGFWVTKNFVPTINQTNFGTQYWWNDYGETSDSSALVGYGGTFETWRAWDGSRQIAITSAPIWSGGSAPSYEFNFSTTWEYSN